MQCFFATTGVLRRRTTFGLAARVLALMDDAEIAGRAAPAAGAPKRKNVVAICLTSPPRRPAQPVVTKPNRLNT